MYIRLIILTLIALLIIAIIYKEMKEQKRKEKDNEYDADDGTMRVLEDDISKDDTSDY